MTDRTEGTPAPLRILHTSDWHLGRQLAGVDRTEDFRSFLSWLGGVLEARRPDLLLLSGDVFDTTMPASDAQRLWYDFLAAAAKTPVGAIVVAAGNHDSPRFLRAPAGLLAAVRTFIAGPSPETEAFVLRDAGGRPRAAVAAVPYLREGDVRRSREGDTDADRAGAWSAGVAERYRAAGEALDRALGASAADRRVPRIAMGHLFVTGARTAGGDDPASGGAWVGSLRNVAADVFGEGWDYVALGHIHRPQCLAARVPVRYSGSPLALDPSEGGGAHRLVEVTFTPDGPETVLIDVPQPRRLERLRGTLAEVEGRIAEIGGSDSGAILEAVVEDPQCDPALLVRRLSEAAQRAGVHLSAVKSVRTRAPGVVTPSRTIDDLSPEDVWRAVLDAAHADAAERAELEPLFREAAEAAGARMREAAAAAAEAGSAHGTTAEGRTKED